MKRIRIAAAMLAASTTVTLADGNSKTENDAAYAALMYLTAQAKCDLPTADLNRLKAAADSVIEHNGLSWDYLKTGQPIIGYFLKEHPIYENAMNDDQAAIASLCGSIRAGIPLLEPPR